MYLKVYFDLQIFNHSVFRLRSSIYVVAFIIQSSLQVQVTKGQISVLRKMIWVFDHKLWALAFVCITAKPPIQLNKDATNKCSVNAIYIQMTYHSNWRLTSFGNEVFTRVWRPFAIIANVPHCIFIYDICIRNRMFELQKSSSNRKVEHNYGRWFARVSIKVKYWLQN